MPPIKTGVSPLDENELYIVSKCIDENAMFARRYPELAKDEIALDPVLRKMVRLLGCELVNTPFNSQESRRDNSQESICDKRDNSYGDVEDNSQEEITEVENPIHPMEDKRRPIKFSNTPSSWEVIVAADPAVPESEPEQLPTSSGIGESDNVNSQPQPVTKLVAVAITAQLDEVLGSSADRAGTRPVHIADSASKLETKKAEKQKQSEGSSLRSEQAQAPDSELEADPWETPEPTKQVIVLADGTRANNMWLFANAANRCSQVDIERLLTVLQFKNLRGAMLRSFAQALRKAYVARWCVAYKRRVNAWRETNRSAQAWTTAAEVLAGEFAHRGMTVDTFIDAAVELSPKAVKFPTVDMFGGILAERIKSWVPPDQRATDKPWITHEDKNGQQWAQLEGDDGGPVLVVRTQADRDFLLKSSRVR